MLAHIILDRYRPHENVTLGPELKKQGIDTQIWCAVHDNSSTAASINRSHKIIVEHAKRTKLPEICIMEEDVWFPSKDGWQYFLKNKPKEFDLYLGGIYGLGRTLVDELTPKQKTIKVRSFTGLHCYIIARKYYDTFLETPEEGHVDVLQDGRGDFRVCFPFAALQHPGWSANNRMMVDYNTPNQIPVDYVYLGR